MARPHRVTLDENNVSSAAAAHEFLADELGFPEWYGANLDALEDCLADIYTPTRIVLVRSQEGRTAWFDDIVEVVRTAAQRSCYLGCTIR